ncbi:MAG: DUF3575 domain-containing protein [Bacteroidales bacterium]|nr:DUF3575 domain-containing protein [Bacteroidales bacterium]
MKKLILSLVLLLSLSFSGFAQSHSMVIKTSPIALAFGNFNVTAEKTLGSTSSVLFSVSYIYKLLGIEVNGFGAQAGYRYYFTNAKKEIPAGFYVNPQVGYSSNKFESIDVLGTGETETYKTSSINIGVEVGYQWVWDSGFALDLGIGPKYYTMSGDTEQASFSGTSGILPSLTFAIGYAF